MNKILGFFIVLLIHCISYADGRILFKTKKVTDSVLHVRGLITNIHDIEKEFSDTKPIHIVISSGKSIVFDAMLGSDSYKRQKIEFYTLDIPEENYLTIKLIDINGNIIQYRSKIMRDHSYSVSNKDHFFTQDNSKQTLPYINIWKVKTFSEAIDLFSGGSKPILFKGKVYSPSCPPAFNKVPATNVYSVLFDLKTDKKLDSIMILSSGGSGVVKAIINIPDTGQVFYNEKKGITEQEKIFFRFPQIVFHKDEKISIVMLTKEGKVLEQKLDTCELTPEDPEYLPVHLEF